MPGNLPVQSIQRTARLLFAVAGSEEGRSIAEIALALGVKPNTAYRLIRTLEQENFLFRKETPLRFFLGEAVAELGHLEERRHLLTVAGRILRRAQVRLPQANLALLELHGNDVFQRLCVESGRPGVLVRRRRYKIDFYSRASSLLFLAYSHPDVAERLYRAHPFEREGKPAWKTRSRLDQFLAKTRRVGWSQPDFPERNFFRLAVPVFSAGGEVLAAVGGFLSLDEPESGRPELVRLCRKTARDIERAL